MGLFRPYERKDEPADAPAPAPEKTPRRRQSMVIAPPSAAGKTAPPRTATARTAPPRTAAARTAPTRTTAAKTMPATTAPATGETSDAGEPSGSATIGQPTTRPRGPQPKAGPTPTRRQAEAARKERLNPSLSPKESRRLAAANAREQRARTMSAAEATPERQLLRDYIDSRFNLGEFLLPACLVILALTFLNSLFPQGVWITTAVMYVFILLVLVDCYVLWRGFRKLLEERHPGATRRGLAFYAMNRAIQIRRLRLPRPRVKRGAKI